MPVQAALGGDGVGRGECGQDSRIHFILERPE
jgi:hypothetical protein